MKRSRFFAIAIFLILAVAVAVFWRLTRPAPGPLRLEARGFADLPGWSVADPRPALAAFRRSCALIGTKSPAQPVGPYGGVVGQWLSACKAAPEKPSGAKSARAFFERWFTPFEAFAGDMSESLFTGYYEPQLRGSRVKSARYDTPVYALPNDLITVDLGRFPSALSTQRIAGRLDGGALVPYATRAEIDARGLEHAKVLFYADDPIALFFLHIQGSGRVRLADGATERVAYAGQNGWPYTPIGRILIAQEGLSRQGMSMQTIRAWLASHPADARRIMESDASFVFFRELPIGDPSLGSPGAEGAPLEPGASLAVDAKIHPLGAPFYVATTMPDSKTPLRRLFIAQDAGGAIRGPLRADVFFGFGPLAEANAGRMKQEGLMFVLLPKAAAQRLARR